MRWIRNERRRSGDLVLNILWSKDTQVLVFFMNCSECVVEFLYVELNAGRVTKIKTTDW